MLSHSQRGFPSPQLTTRSSALGFLLLILASDVRGKPDIDPEIYKALEENPTTRIIVQFQSSLSKDAIDCHERKKRSDGERDFGILAQELMDIADESQSHTIRTIQRASTAFPKQKSSKPSVFYDTTQIWFTNELVVSNADAQLLAILADMENVTSVNADLVGKLDQLPSSECDDDDYQEKVENSPNYSSSQVLPNQSNEKTLNLLQVNSLWDKNLSGNGVVIGSVAGGVDPYHESVKYKFRHDHGWLDPAEGSNYPYDSSPLDQGTSSVSIAVGLSRNEYFGIAHEAQWIACNAIKKEHYYLSLLKLCIQFMVCPTDTRGKNPDCSLRPDIVGIGYGWAYDPQKPNQNLLAGIDILETAGLLVIASTGQWEETDTIKEACYTVTQAAGHEYTIAVGSIHEYGLAGTYSRWGPSKDGLIKPEVVTPGGVHVWVAVTKKRQRDYFGRVNGAYISEGSVVGVAALLRQAFPTVNQRQLKEAFTKTAIKPEARLGRRCNGTGENDIPNNLYGYGVVQALEAFKFLENVFAG